MPSDFFSIPAQAFLEDELERRTERFLLALGRDGERGLERAGVVVDGLEVGARARRRGRRAGPVELRRLLAQGALEAFVIGGAAGLDGARQD